MQAKKWFLSLTALLLVGTGPAWSATAVGRITYIYPDGHRFILNSGSEYTLGPNVSASSLAVAELVRVESKTRGGQAIATSVSPGPASAANN
jgi:hypothetical protein